MGLIFYVLPIHYQSVIIMNISKKIEKVRDIFWSWYLESKEVIVSDDQAIYVPIEFVQHRKNK